MPVLPKATPEEVARILGAATLVPGQRSSTGDSIMGSGSTESPSDADKRMMLEKASAALARTRANPGAKEGNQPPKSEPMDADFPSDCAVLEVRDGVLALRGVNEPLTRRPFYEDEVNWWSDSSQDLIVAMSACPPMAWHITSLYVEFVDTLDDAAYEAAMAARADSDEEQAALAWIEGIDDETFKACVVPSVQRWLDQAPDWSHEQDYLPANKIAYGAAYELFSEMDAEDLEGLGVELTIVGGVHSHLECAVLRSSIDAVNQIATDCSLAIRFVTAPSR
ncbi:hypothetical protein [Piscinibacterium candidicorallinum]|uniref:Uncharacterized protein n=1 Tax=Piscinibacterium candidicorallinum TaxID=1793872 RepID=A0ABV7H3C6_9BURK